MTFTTPYISFWTRLRKKFLGQFIILAIVIICIDLTSEHSFFALIVTLMLFALGLLCLSIASVWTSVNEVEFIDDKIIITGYSMNSQWVQHFSILGSQIKIKSKSHGRGNVEYYLRISTGRRYVDINRSLNWNYPSLLTIFEEFKKLKGEKIIYDEKYFIDIIRKKAAGFSMWDIASGKSLTDERKEE